MDKCVVIDKGNVTQSTRFYIKKTCEVITVFGDNYSFTALFVSSSHNNKFKCTVSVMNKKSCEGLGL